MNSLGICSRCLRTLRQSLRTERCVQSSVSAVNSQYPYDLLKPRSSRIPPSYSRTLSACALLSQKTQSASEPVEINPEGAIAEPKAKHPQPAPVQNDHSQPQPSTAEMQRTINANISSSSSRRRSLPQALAQSIRHTKTAETYITYGVTEALFKTCSAQTDYTIPESQRGSPISGKGPVKTADGEDLGVPTAGSRDSWWFSSEDQQSMGLSLPPTFSTWSQITYLHMYLLLVYLRSGVPDPQSLQSHHRYLVDHFSHAAEDKMAVLHTISARSVRNQYLKDLFVRWRGVLAAYDEGLVRGDAVLAAAVWRNVWKGDPAVDWVKVGLVVGWMRAVLDGLGRVRRVEELLPNHPLGGLGSVFDQARQRMRKVQQAQKAAPGGRMEEEERLRV